MFRILIVLLFFQSLIATPLIKTPMKDIYLDKYSSLSYGVPEGTFISDKNSTTFLRLTKNKWISVSLSQPIVDDFHPLITATDYDIQGDVLYIVDNGFGLFIMDISSTEEFQLLGYLEIDGNVNGIATSGKFVFIGSDGENVFIAVNIENPKNPIVVGSIPFSLSGISSSKNVIINDQDENFIHLFGDYEQSESLITVNVTDKLNLTITGSVTFSYDVKNLFSRDSYLFISSCYMGFYIYNVTDKTKFEEIGNCDTPSGCTYDIYVDKELKYAYIADEDEFLIANVENLVSPSIVGSYGGIFSCYSIGVTSGANLTFIGTFAGTFVMNTTDKTSPQLLGGIVYPTDVYSKVFKILIQESRVLVSHEYKGIVIYNISESVERPTSFYSNLNYFGNSIFKIDLEDNYLFAADGFTGLKVFDITNRHMSPLVSNLELGFNDFARDVKVKDGFICKPNYRCSCYSGFLGDNCETWRCEGFDFKDTSKVCNGNGDCTEPGTCECNDFYTGKDCKVNTFVNYGVIPVSSVTGSILITGIVGGTVFLFCCVCLTCSCLCICLCIGLCGLCAVVSSQRFKMIKNEKKFDGLDIETILPELRMEADKTIAHIRINKSLFEIEYEEIKVQKILGEGGSNSVVYKAEWRKQVVAFKCFKTRNLCSSQESYDEFEKEIQVFASISFPFIVRFLGCSLGKNRVGIVMEFCPLGELFEFIAAFKANNGASYPILEKLRLLEEVALAIDYLHSRNVIHRDLKCENVLIDAQEHAKLMDFGLSKINADKDAIHTTRVGTSFYMAPEVIVKGKYDEKCDVFSFAVMSFIIFTENNSPYGNTELYGIELKVANDAKFRPNIRELKASVGITHEDHHLFWLISLCENGWDADPLKRRSMSDVVKLFGDHHKNIIDVSSEERVKNKTVIQLKESSEEEEEEEIKKKLKRVELEIEKMKIQKKDLEEILSRMKSDQESTSEESSSDKSEVDDSSNSSEEDDS